jgi:hypothetical protein
LVFGASSLIMAYKDCMNQSKQRRASNIDKNKIISPGVFNNFG